MPPVDDTLTIEPRPASIIVRAHDLHAEDGPDQVDGQDLIEVGPVELHERTVAEDAGVVHEDVRLSRTSQDRLVQATARQFGLVGHVEMGVGRALPPI